MDNTRLKINTEQLGKAIGKSRKTIFNYRERGMPSYKNGNDVYFYVDEVAEWLNQQAIRMKETNLMVHKATTLVLPIQMVLEAYNDNLKNLKRLETLKEAGVKFNNEMKEDYSFYKEQVNQALSQHSYFDKLEELVIIVDFLIKQSPVNLELLSENVAKLIILWEPDSIQKDDSGKWGLRG